MIINAKRTIGAAIVGLFATISLSGCSSKKSKGIKWEKGTPNETIIKQAAEKNAIGNWGLGNEYEVYAVLQKYGLEKKYVVQDFTMDSFDDGTISLASAMTYNELGLVKNSYDGGYKYGDKVGIIDFNTEGVAMLEDNIFCTKEFAQANPNTVKAFIYASMKGWAYAAAHPDEAAEIVYQAGSSVSLDHQKYMAKEMAKLVTTNMAGNTVTVDGTMYEDSLSQTLSIAKQYISLSDSVAAARLASMTLSDFSDTQYVEAAKASTDGNFGTLEKTSVKIQLKWLPQAQFMGYYVAKAKGYYTEVGFTNVDIISGGGDITETTAVQNGTVDFGQSWVSSTIAANAAGSNLLQVAQVAQRSGLVLVYKYK
ncbi:MAG: ABC transporter substrate-binding protein [Acholeplasmatales bacterium]|nr:ABC transporter substrate-binding protein [Acholeplasmatales bacterium]